MKTLNIFATVTYLWSYEKNIRFEEKTVKFL